MQVLPAAGVFSLALSVVAPTLFAAERVPSVATHHPRGWRFTMPKGDPVKGRGVFEKFECYYCHRVRGENFPEPTDSGPELSQMGPLHPAEFFAESIIHPSAVAGKADRGKDGRSLMSEDHLKKMTLQELIDLTSYIAALKPPLVTGSVGGVGKIVAILPQTQEIVIDHQEIKGFMDAMTMGYKVAATGQLKGLAEGDLVTFTIDTQRRVITKIAKSKK